MIPPRLDDRRGDRARRRANGMPRASVERLERRELLAVAVVDIVRPEGVPFSGTVARFAAGDVTGGVADYKATINWGDGSATAPAVPFVDSAGVFGIPGTHIYLNEGLYSVSVSVTGLGTSTASGAGKATIADTSPILTPPSLSATATVPFSGAVASFTDADPDPPGLYAVGIDWGDGKVTPGAAVAKGPGLGFNVVGTHAYAAPGSYTVAASVTTLGGATSSAAGTALVADPVPVVLGRAITPSVKVPFNGPVATFKDADASLSAANFVATIIWGDTPTVSYGQITGTAGNFTVSGSHVYSAPGTFDTSVTITRLPDDAKATAHGSAIVSASSLPLGSAVGTTITAVAGVPFVGLPVAKFNGGVGTKAGEFAATINWGDGQNGSGQIVNSTNPDGSEVDGVFQITGSHAYDAKLPNPTITVTIVRAFSGQAPVTVTTAAVVLSSPVVATASHIISASPGVALDGVEVGSFVADPSAKAGDFSATINWGDGSPVAAGTVVGDGAGNFRVLGSHTYANPSLVDPYPITVAVTQAFSGTTGGAVTTIHGRAVVAIPTFSGGLDPASDTGRPGDGITNISGPILLGQAAPYSIVQVDARRGAVGEPSPVGRTIANADGTWRLALGHLDDGRYAFTATVTPPNGSPIVDQPFRQPVVIDTVAPRVQSVRYNPKTGVVTAIFRDEGAGLDLATLQDVANFNLIGHPARKLASANAPALVGAQILSNDPQAVTVTLSPRRPARGLRTLRIVSGGVADLAGNPLDGENTGHVPSGNGRPGGNYLGRLAPGGITLHTLATPAPQGIRALRHRPGKR